MVQAFFFHLNWSLVVLSRVCDVAAPKMSSKRDMRRADLIVPYAEPRKEQEGPDMASMMLSVCLSLIQSDDVPGTMSTTLPMMAIFTRNKLLGWCVIP